MDSGGRIWTGVLRVAPHRGDHRVAIRAAVSLLVPLLALWALGRIDLSVYATFGAFAAIYGRNDPIRPRIRMQVTAGLVLLAAMCIGTALSALAAPALVSVAVIAALAAIITVLSQALRWHPPGALFVVFASGATASIPATASTFAAVLLVGGSSVLFALVVSGLFALAFERKATAPASVVRAARPPLDVEIAVCVGVATAIAGVVATILLDSHWYWAMVGAVAALSGPHINARIIRGLQRLIGTLLGVLIAAGLLALDLPPLAIVLLAGVFQAGAELFIGRNYAIAMLFVTPLALMMVELAAPTSPELLLRDRVLETVIGVASGMVIAGAAALLRRRGSKASL